jgi:hypothetical protein
VQAIVITSVVGFMAALDDLIVTTALLSIRKDLGGGLDDREWTVSAYILTCAVLGCSAPPSVTASAAEGCSSQGSRFSPPPPPRPRSRSRTAPGTDDKPCPMRPPAQRT